VGSSAGLRWLSSASATTSVSLYTQYVIKALNMFNNTNVLTLYASLPWGSGLESSELPG
jgi:hypothetical protein